jgi:hypothetical protein
MKAPVWASCLIALLPLMGHADPEPWMAKDDSLSLPYIAYVKSQCPMVNRDITALVEKQFVEAGLKTQNVWPHPDGMFLGAKVECVEFKPDVFAFVTTIGFGRILDGRVVFEFYDSGDIGVVSRDNSSFILESVELGVECALSNYLEANFEEEMARREPESSATREVTMRTCARH